MSERIRCTPRQPHEKYDGFTVTNDNRVCVKVSEDGGLKFMDVTLPEYAEVKVSKQGTVWVNVNESCVFRLCKAGKLVVKNEFAEPTAKPDASTG